MIKTYTKDTLTRGVLEQGVKLRVTDVHHSRAFQRACFDLKVFWEHGKGEQHTSEPYLFVEACRGNCFCATMIFYLFLIRSQWLRFILMTGGSLPHLTILEREYPSEIILLEWLCKELLLFHLMGG